MTRIGIGDIAWIEVEDGVWEEEDTGDRVDDPYSIVMLNYLRDHHPIQITETR